MTHRPQAQLVVVHVVRPCDTGYQFLILKRCSAYLFGNWQMVTGKIEPGERAPDAAIRELKEETGLSASSLYSADFIEIFYEHHRDRISHAPVFLAFVSADATVKLSIDEHDAYQWLSYAEALSYYQFKGQRDALRHIQEQFIERRPNPFFLITDEFKTS